MTTLTRQLAISNAGLDLIASFEGFRADMYNDPAGHATIGFGHLIHLGPINGSEPAEFRQPLSLAAAKELLRKDAARFEQAVRTEVTVPLTQQQFDSLVSFAFNVGAGNLRGSTLLRKLNAADYAAARGEFAKWNKAGGQVLPGLVRRRAAEAQMFGGDAPVVPAPRPPAVSLQSLRRGQRNNDVKIFQERLRGNGLAHLNPHGATGIYGNETCAMCAAAYVRNGWTATDPAVPDARVIEWLGLTAL